MSKFLDSQGVTDLTKQYDERYNKKLTSSSVNDGTPDKVIAFDSNGNLIKGNVSGIDLGYPAYSASSTYAIGDVVIYDNKIYQCITAISTAEAWTAAHWNKIVASVNDIITINSSSTSGTLTDEQLAKITANKVIYIDYSSSSSDHAFYRLVGYRYNQYISPAQYQAVFVYDNIAVDAGATIYNRMIVVKMTSKTWTKNESSSTYVQSINGQKGQLSIDTSLKTYSYNMRTALGLTGKLPYLTTAPTADNDSNKISIVVLDAEPATRYNGYLYIITASAA